MNITRENLPAHWELTTMGEVADVVGGSTPKSKEPAFWDGDIPWLGVADLTGYTNKYIGGGARSITQAGYDSCATQMLPAGSVLFSSRAPIGYVAIADRPVCTSQGFKSFVPSDEVSADYLYWYLKYARPIAESMASGTTFKELSGKAAAKLPLPLPPRREQDEIARALDTQMARVSAGRASIERAHRRLDAYRASVLRAVFTGALTTFSAATRDGLANAERVPLGDMSTIQYGYTASAREDAVGPRMLRITDIQNGRVDWGAVPYCEVGAEDDASKYFLQPGDVVFARLGFTTGKSFLIPSDVPASTIFASYLIRVRSDDRVLPDYLGLFFQSAEYWLYVYSKRQGIDRPALNGKVLSALPVPVPSLDLQAEAVEAAQRHQKSVADLGELLANELGAADELVQSLLHTAFTGNLAARAGAAAETGAELLARVQAARGARGRQTKRRRAAAVVE